MYALPWSPLYTCTKWMTPDVLVATRKSIVEWRMMSHWRIVLNHYPLISWAPYNFFRCNLRLTYKRIFAIVESEVTRFNWTHSPPRRQCERSKIYFWASGMKLITFDYSMLSLIVLLPVTQIYHKIGYDWIIVTSITTYHFNESHFS